MYKAQRLVRNSVQPHRPAVLCVIYAYCKLSSPLRGLYRIVTYSSAKKKNEFVNNICFKSLNTCNYGSRTKGHKHTETTLGTTMTGI
jgi:hypothetical protein